MTEERYELAVGRIREMIGETSVEERFRDYFDRTAAFLLLVDEVKEALKLSEGFPGGIKGMEPQDV